jgi:hypothetical protein
VLKQFESPTFIALLFSIIYLSDGFACAQSVVLPLSAQDPRPISLHLVHTSVTLRLSAWRR